MEVRTGWRVRGRLGRRPASALVALLAFGLAPVGCATKRDIKNLQSEVIALQMRQDSLFRLLQQQNSMLLDTLRAASELLVRVRGSLANQLLAMEQQLVQIQELTGQSQRRLAELRQQMEARASEFEATAPAATPAPGSTGAAPEQLYAIGTEQLQRGAYSTARRAFEQILREHPTHERAPDAQFQLAETYALEKNFERAYREFERVAELYPSSPRAPAALYRAGVIAEEQRNNTKARQYFEKVVAGYPNSDEARSARTKLQRLRR